jgi:hypothetical protein
MLYLCEKLRATSLTLNLFMPPFLIYLILKTQRLEMILASGGDIISF